MVSHYGTRAKLEWDEVRQGRPRAHGASNARLGPGHFLERDPEPGEELSALGLCGGQTGGETLEARTFGMRLE